jgi:site-specific recombinase XerC
VIEAAKNNRHGHRDATMILVAYRHGLRAAEVCSLEWSQVDFASATFSGISFCGRHSGSVGALVEVRSGQHRHGATGKHLARWGRKPNKGSLEALS